jgi:dihydroflavonol-4-reductase
MVSKVNKIPQGDPAMRVFVTGGTGFIGSKVVKRLVALGYEVICVVRSFDGEQQVIAAGAIPSRGDICKVRSLDQPMRGCDLVIHIAGHYHLGEKNEKLFYAVNVHGTRHVIETAIALEIPRIVVISSIAIYGDTHGNLATEETQMLAKQPFVSSYDHSKWLADQEIIRPLVRQGAPIITIIPSAVVGPGDPSLIGQIMRAFLQGWLVAFPGPETFLSLTFVDDVAEGIVLAALYGKLGDRYILAGDSVTLKELCLEWVKLTGWPAPILYVPAWIIHPLASLALLLSHIFPDWPEIMSRGAIRVLGVSYAGCADKARRDLGWQPRSLSEGLNITLEWMRKQPGIPENACQVRRRQTWGVVLIAFFLLGISGFLHRNLNQFEPVENHKRFNL